MECNMSGTPEDGRCTEMMKTLRKLPNMKLKDRVSDHRFAHRLKKPSVIDEDIDNDVILRMVLPGYNWFEDQVKNNMYTAEGEKKTVTRIKAYTKSKTVITGLSHPRSVGKKIVEPTTKQKAPLTKRVINSTLMLLPNNSLPLKKRKIKDMDENSNELKISGQPQEQEAKKAGNPPIQKVTPILNNTKYNPIEDPPKPPIETKVHHTPRTSAFNSDHIQKKYPDIQYYYPSLGYPHNYPLDNNSRHQTLARKNNTYPILDIRCKYQSPCNVSFNGCHQCNLYRYQTNQMNKLQSQDTLKIPQNNPPNQTIAPQRNYWSSNFHPNFVSYEPLAFQDSGIAYPRTHQSLYSVDNLNVFAQPENICQQLNPYNPHALVYNPKNLWNKANLYPYKNVQMNSLSSDYSTHNAIDPFGSVPRGNQPYPLYLKEYHPIR